MLIALALVLVPVIPVASLRLLAVLIIALALLPVLVMARTVVQEIIYVAFFSVVTFAFIPIPVEEVSTRMSALNYCCNEYSPITIG